MGPEMNLSGTQGCRRRLIGVGIILVIALIHLLRVGRHLPGGWFSLYASYFSDLVGPLGIYFLLCVAELKLPVFRPWTRKALTVFLLAAASEGAQALGVPLLGRTFDPLDFVMFGGGVMLAVLLDRWVLAPMVPGWVVADRA